MNQGPLPGSVLGVLLAVTLASWFAFSAGESSSELLVRHRVEPLLDRAERARLDVDYRVLNETTSRLVALAATLPPDGAGVLVPMLRERDVPATRYLLLEFASRWEAPGVPVALATYVRDLEPRPGESSYLEEVGRTFAALNRIEIDPSYEVLRALYGEGRDYWTVPLLQALRSKPRRLELEAEIRPHVNGEHPALRRAAVLALEGAREPETVEALIARFPDEENGLVRAAIAAILASTVATGTSPDRVVPLLGEALEDRDRRVQKEAIDALVTVGTPACAERLGTFLRELKPGRIRSLVVHALSQIGDQDLPGPDH